MFDPSKLATTQCFQDEVLEGLDLRKADLSGKEFCGCTFRRVKLQEGQWDRSRLEDCVFEDCDLTRVASDQIQVAMYGVTFRRSKLMGNDWSGLSPNPTIAFEECDIRYISFVGTNLSRSLIRGCRAVEANFYDCNLSGADFSGTDLTGAIFEGSNLTDADLGTAVGVFLDPAKNRVKGARIPVESAVLLAMSSGMRVMGCETDDHRRARR